MCPGYTFSQPHQKQTAKEKVGLGDGPSPFLGVSPIPIACLLVHMPAEHPRSRPGRHGHVVTARGLTYDSSQQTICAGVKHVIVSLCQLRQRTSSRSAAHEDNRMLLR